VAAAYQDATLGSLLETRGERAGSYSNMNRALRPGRPLEVHLATSFPVTRSGSSAQHLRDQMKVGAAFRTVLETESARITGINFAFPRRLTDDEIDEGVVAITVQPHLGPPLELGHQQPPASREARMNNLRRTTHSR